MPMPLPVLDGAPISRCDGSSSIKYWRLVKGENNLSQLQVELNISVVCTSSVL